MASAPRPGAHREATEATRRFKVRVRDVTLEFPASMTIQERFSVRNVTGGFPLDTLIRYPDESTLVILWWLARRKNGEPSLSLKAAELDLEGITPDEFDVEVIDDDGEETDDPEGSGPGS